MRLRRRGRSHSEGDEFNKVDGDSLEQHHNQMVMKEKMDMKAKHHD